VPDVHNVRDVKSKRFGSTLALALAALAAACAGGNDGGQSSGGAGGGAGSGAGGGAGSGMGGGAGGSSATGGAGGTSATGGSGGGGTGGNAGAGGGAAGAGGSAAGAGGSAGTPGGCPADMIFCTGFEMSGMPTGATFQDPDESGGGTVKFGTPMVMTLDTTAPFDGAQSLKVTSAGPFTFRMLGVAVPATFWVRLHIKSDQDIGQEGHNAFFQAMTDANYHNSTHSVEVSEQFGCIVLNDHDTLFPTGTTCAANTALPKNTWHCMEAMFDGTTGNVQVYANGTKIIDAVAWAPAVGAAFKEFEFGYANYHDPAASVWYDDVAIAPTRIGCP
jgi:hypothetical protein